MVISASQSSRSPLKNRFPSSNQCRQHLINKHCLNYPTTGIKDDNKCEKHPTCDSYENAGRRQFNPNTYEYSNMYILTATIFSENKLQKQFSLPNCVSSSVTKIKEYDHPDRNEKDLSNDLLSHWLQVTIGSTSGNRNNVVLHRIPIGPPPSPPREPTYPPTCPPSLAPPYPAPSACPYSRPRPIFPPVTTTRERCDVPVYPPCTVYPVPPPAVTFPKCPPVTTPLRDTRLPKRNPRPQAQKKTPSSFKTKVYCQVNNCARHHFHHHPQLLPLTTLLRFVR